MKRTSPEGGDSKPWRERFDHVSATIDSGVEVASRIGGLLAALAFIIFVVWFLFQGWPAPGEGWGRQTVQPSLAGSRPSSRKTVKVRSTAAHADRRYITSEPGGAWPKTRLAPETLLPAPSALDLIDRRKANLICHPVTRATGRCSAVNASPAATSLLHLTISVKPPAPGVKGHYLAASLDTSR